MASKLFKVKEEVVGCMNEYREALNTMFSL